MRLGSLALLLTTRKRHSRASFQSVPLRMESAPNRRDTRRAMSEDNVDLARRAYEAFNRGDVETVLTLVDENVEIASRLAPLGEGSYHGHEGVRRWFQNLWDTFPDWRSELVELRDAGDITVGTVRIRGHGRESGAPLDQTIWQVMQWRNGECVRLTPYDSEAEALEAAGLSE